MGLFQSKERQQQQQDAAELDEWFADVQRIKQQCCDDPWYQHKLAISKTTVEVADEYVGTQSDINALFPGVHKYLGGAKDERDGCIYGIPSHARSVICLYPTRESKTATTNNEEEVRYKIRLEPLPEHAANGQFKWLRIIAHGYLYGIPAWANTVLQVDIDAMGATTECDRADCQFDPSQGSRSLTMATEHPQSTKDSNLQHSK
ncbi:hypothetical protein MHU86_4601 [Fragilaria crotonensis]|nr:hypothetical protein MHU86_4601 [Fragilaria crotonensis]